MSSTQEELEEFLELFATKPYDRARENLITLIDSAKREAIENHPIISLLHELDDTLPEGKYSTITMQYMPGGKAKLQQSEESI